MPWPGPSRRRWGERERPASPHSKNPCLSPPQLGSHLLSSAETQAPETARCHPRTPGTSPSACQCLRGWGAGGCEDTCPGPLELPLSPTPFGHAMPPAPVPSAPGAHTQARGVGSLEASPSKLPSWVPQYFHPHHPGHHISPVSRLRPCASQRPRPFPSHTRTHTPRPTPAAPDLGWPPSWS